MFMAYHDNQPFNENMLRPCPMLENPEFIEKMVHETGAHSTDPQSPESVEHLTAKTHPMPTTGLPWPTSCGQSPIRLRRVRRLWQHRLRPVTTVTKARVRSFRTRFSLSKIFSTG